MSTNTLKQALEIVYGDIKNINKRVKNLESASIGVIYNETLKSAVAYQDNVSANACPYALLNKVGGMSYKSENLFDKASANLNKTIDTTTGDLLDNNNYMTSDYIEVEPNAQYSNNVSGISFNICYYDENKTFVSGQTKVTPYTIPSNAHYIRIGAFKTRLDTFMFVKGSTAPTEYQPYFEGIRDSAVSSVISKDSNNTALQTISIPNAIQQLEGYGWGINDTCYNYIDFENKKFAKKEAKVDLGTLNWTYNATTKRFETVSLQTLLKEIPTSTTVANLLCDIYTTVSGQTQYDNLTLDMTISQGTTSSPLVRVRNLAYTDATAFKTAMSGVYLYYELATPIETDISSYLPADFNSIQIETNGNITFDNTYQQAIPYEYLYLEKVGANNE